MIYYVARMIDGAWQVLDNAPTHVDAAMLLGAYRNMFPNSRLGIVSNTHFESPTN
jgi:hypothetical protein